jgi:hypothetical protein
VLRVDLSKPIASLLLRSWRSMHYAVLDSAAEVAGALSPWVVGALRTSAQFEALRIASGRSSDEGTDRDAAR